MSIPDYQTLMLPVLKFASSGQEVSVRDATEALSREFGLTPEERRSLLPSGKTTTIYSRTQWAKAYLKQAGLVENSRRGHFAITQEGKKVLASNPSHIDVKFLRSFPSFPEFEKRAGASASDDRTHENISSRQVETPEELIQSAHEQLETTLAHELLDRIRQAPPEFFESLIVSLLLAMGYGGSLDNAGRALGRSGDGGVDGVIDQDARGLDRVFIQAKRYMDGNNIGSGAIRDFFGSLNLNKATKGLFVTTSTFSPSAVKTAEQLSHRIVLVDGEHLAKLMVRYNIGCRIEETLYIRRLDEDFFD